MASSHKLLATSFWLPQLTRVYLITLKNFGVKNFKQLTIWQKGMNIAVNCFKLTVTFPEHLKYGLSAQVNKSGVSIPSNIAEGNSRKSEKDKARFIEISLGSSFELETQLLIAQKAGFGNQELLKQVILEVAEEQKMLMTFYDRLKP